MKRKYRITSPVRFFLFILLVVLTATMAIYSMLGASTSEASSVDVYRQIEVRSDDTLWTIANEYCDGDVDTRDTVKKICEINDIEASDLEPGEKILVPVEA